jgi:L,D-transpeptidase ErfK/SrfK
VHTPLDGDGMPSTLDRQAAIEEALNQRNDAVVGIRLNWQAIRDAVFAEEGIPVLIGEATQGLGPSKQINAY